VLVDVSGSVEAPQLQRFANELDRILRTLRADIHLIIGDDRVRAQHLLRPGVKPLRELTFDGGGSTDFEPMLQAASELRPDLGVFLTDLDGPAGEPVSWPLLWLVPAAARENPRPFGQRIVLD
jgi:predicted metal-dependent peptidase